MFYDDEHVRGVEAQLPEYVHHLVLLGTSLVDLEAVLAVPPQVPGYLDDISVKPGDWPPAFIFDGVVEEEAHPRPVLAPADEVAELLRPLGICVSEGYADPD